MSHGLHECPMEHWTDRIRLALATCFGLGYFPVCPGTAGALLGVLIYVLIALFGPPALQTWLIAGALLLVSLATFFLSHWAERYWQRKDPQSFVADEVAGFLLTVLLYRLPSVGWTVLICFPVTRAFDIVKLPPARRIEQLPGGWGILMDDLLASIYAAAVLHGMTILYTMAFAMA